MKSAREKILNTASKLFYRHGIHNIGVDEIVRQARVNKMTLYRHFPSKEILAASCLGEIHQQWSTWFQKRVKELASAVKKPEDRVLAIFDALEEWFQTPGFRGCPFINTVTEISNPKHPARKAAVEFKQKLLETLEHILKSEGKFQDEMLPVQLLLLVDGAVVRALMTDSSHPARAARSAAARLLQ